MAGPDDPTAPSFGTALDGPVPPDVLGARLVDGHGRVTSLGALRGKVVVLSDVLTQCQESCPVGTASILQAARAINRTSLGSQVEFVSLTIDPRRDDARHLRAYESTFGTLPNWEVLSGDPATLDRLWTRLGIWRHRTQNSPPYPRDWVTGQALHYDLSHTDELIFIDARQHFRYEADGFGSLRSGRAIPPRIYRFMDALGHRNLKQQSPDNWSPGQVVDVVRWLTGGSS
ncbi:MAG: SCO family protein [Nocardioides sp.]